MTPAGSPMVRAITCGFALGWARLRPRSLLIMAAFGAAVVLMVSMVEKGAGPLGAADRSLIGTFGTVVPLVTFAVVLQGSARMNLAESVWTLARHGLARWAVALGTILTMTLVAAVLSAAFAALAVVCAGGQAVAPLLSDALTSAWIGALAGCTYVGWFAAFGTLGRLGGARVLPLFLDLGMRGGTFALAAVFPGAHALNLLGGPAPLSATPAKSALFLVVTAVALDLAAAVRCGR